MIAVVIFKAGRKVQVVRQARVLVVVLVVDILLVLHSDRGEMCERLPQTQSRCVGAMAGEKDREYSGRVCCEAPGWCSALHLVAMGYCYPVVAEVLFFGPPFHKRRGGENLPREKKKISRHQF